MTRASPRFGVLVLVAAAGVVWGGDSGASERAEEKQACASAAEEAEQLRIDAHFLAARERLLRCSRTECPATVRDDCAQWMTEVTAAIPTVVLAARDPRGEDVLGARVTVDGAAMARGLDGKAIEVDPGIHKFRFEGAGVSAEEVVIIREGEKNRAITVTLATRPTATPADASSPPTPARPSPRASAWTWIFGGLGLVAIGVGTYFELSVNADAATLQGTCGHTCSHAQVDPLVLEQQVFGPLAFGVGAASLGVAAYTLFAVPTAGGAVAGATGSF